MRLRDALAIAETPDDRFRRVVALHLDPQRGSRFWLERAQQRGLEAPRDLQRLDDLPRLGESSPADLRERPVWDYVPRVFHDRLDRFTLAQAGGGSGTGVWTAYRGDEFEEAFVLPFASAAAHVGFPPAAVWLYIGPGGPHLAGKVARHLANALGGPDPFSLDFDPRWAERLPEESFGHRRYVHHVIEQALDIIRGQAIEVLFSTPALLRQLGEMMGPGYCRRIRGVHYGGAGVPADELAVLQQRVFPNAVHLCSYGNALFGRCVETCTAPGRRPCYFPYGNRLILEAVGETGDALPPGFAGRLRFTRLDESMLIVRCHLDGPAVATVPPTDGLPEGYGLPGITQVLEQTHAPGCRPRASAGA